MGFEGNGTGLLCQHSAKLLGRCNEPLPNVVGKLEKRQDVSDAISKAHIAY